MGFLPSDRSTREQLVELPKSEPEKIADLVLELWDQVVELRERVKRLERDSHNSHKPPSTDRGLGARQLIPYRRLAEVFADLFGASLSAGTLANFVKRGGAKATEAMLPVREALIQAPVVHALLLGNHFLNPSVLSQPLEPGWTGFNNFRCQLHETRHHRSRRAGRRHIGLRFRPSVRIRGQEKTERRAPAVALR